MNPHEHTFEFCLYIQQCGRAVRINGFNTIAWNNRGAYRQYDVHYYRAKALEMLRRLHTEPLTPHSRAVA